MKWLPIGTISIPVEPRSDARLLDLKIFTDAIHNLFKGRRTIGVLANKVCTLMPRNPLTIADIFLLEGSHFGNEGIVKGPIRFGSE